MLNISLFERFERFVETLLEEDRVKIDDVISALRHQEFDVLYIKEISGPVREVRLDRYRILFAIEYSTVYIFTAFRKKTLKTPRDEREFALKMYKLLSASINQN